MFTFSKLQLQQRNVNSQQSRSVHDCSCLLGDGIPASGDRAAAGGSCFLISLHPTAWDFDLCQHGA
jgi:hypothetical protein